MNLASKYTILLASQSPRRKELLSQLGYSFSCIALDIDESYPETLQKHEITEFLTEKKSYAFGELQKNELILTADTIVWHKEKCLEKPKNQQDAKEMLQSLSNSEHFVYTSIAMRTQTDFQLKTDCAKVCFSELSEEEIHYYIETAKPYDKAGSYGIQDFIGLAKINRIEGSYFTVMGLPTHLVYEMLQNI